MFLRRRFLALFLLALAAVPALAQDTFKGVQRIVAIGDVHGDYDQFVSLLRSAELIDNRNRWTGGRAHLVQTGDVLDRGPASRKAMDLLMDLEEQARRDGGAVHALLGNHEAMNIYGDFRYTTKEEYESYRTQRSEALRDQYFRLVAAQLRKKGSTTEQIVTLRKTFDDEHPLGWVEHLQAFGPEGVYGQWVRQHQVIIRINDVIFLHGGISPKYAATTIREFNDRVRAEFADFKKLENGMARAPDGPLWYRGLAMAPESELAAHVDRVLAAHGAHHMVNGHTQMPAVVLPRFGGKVILIDVGLSRTYEGGTPALLIIEGSKYYALHRGHRLELPVEGGDVLPYLRAAAAFDPQPSPIQKLIDTMAGQ